MDGEESEAHGRSEENGKRSAGQVQVEVEMEMELEVDLDVHTYVLLRQLTLMMSLYHVSLFQSLTSQIFDLSLPLYYTFVFYHNLRPN